METDNTFKGTCLTCNETCLSSEHCINVFDSQRNGSTDNLVLIISKLLNKDIKEDTQQSQVLCNKCHKLVLEFGELQVRVAAIKHEIFDQHRGGVHKIELDNESGVTETKEVAQLRVVHETGKESEITKKMLFVPSSDEDSTNVLADKIALDDDIGMSFVKIQEKISISKDQDTNENKMNAQEVDNGQTFKFCTDDGDILDSGAIEHSSDSDYEPPSIIFQASEVTSNHIDNNISKVKIKLETTDLSVVTSHHSGMEKPNILKKKVSTIISQDVQLQESSQVKNSDFYNVSIVSRNGNIYTCLLCTGNETVAGEAKAIILHMKDVHSVRLYICDVCGDDFRKRNLLSMHLDEHVAAEEGDFQCEICNRIFSNLRLFRIHKRMHYPQNKAWECQTCGKKYSSKNLLEEHVNSHLGVRPYVCQICGKDFASKYTFKAHEKTHEIRPRPFRCSQCGKTFLSQQNLTQHERTHSGMKEFACHLCGKQFGSAHNLEVHSIVHSGCKPYACGLCGKAFARKAEIRDHERTHTGERPYQCEFCGATFSQRSNLQSHKRATHYDDKRYHCSDCNRAFKRRRLLDYHVKAVHTGERPFKCEVCEATFVYPEHLKKHRRIHTGEKPFLCEICGKAFNSRDNHNAHKFIHCDKKPYECLTCGAGFMRKPVLYQHMQQQGHFNDTIVVNRPSLFTEDNQLVTVNSAGQMELVDTVPVTEDSKLYIQDSDTERIIIDGQQITFASDDENEGEIIDEIEQVVAGPIDDDYEEIITSEALAGSEMQIIETPDGPVQLVKVRVPNENGEEEEAWIKIISEEMA